MVKRGRMQLYLPNKLYHNTYFRMNCSPLFRHLFNLWRGDGTKFDKGKNFLRLSFQYVDRIYTSKYQNFTTAIVHHSFSNFTMEVKLSIKIPKGDIRS